MLLATFSSFSDDNCLKFSASLAYYTVFSLAPLLILVISLAGLVFGEAAAANRLYPQISHYVGAQPALQIQEILKHLQLSGKSGIAVAIGVITLMMGASGIFLEIQDSLNIIWRVRAKPKRGWLKLIQNRFLSFSLIISLGFLLLVSLIINFIMQALSEFMERYLHKITTTLINGIDLGITIVVITILFGIIFKFLPDVKIKWKDVKAGAFFTALLFMLGQFIIGLYLKFSAQGSAYGAAGSIIVILVWIYYTAAILYIGAEFTRVFAEANGSHIEPADYAVHVEQKEIEHVVTALPPQNPELQGNLKKETTAITGNR